MSPCFVSRCVSRHLRELMSTVCSMLSASWRREDYRIPNNAVGDNGKAIGAYQIHYAYWKDAVDYDPSIGGKYSDCKDPKYARRIVRSYLSRYVPKGGWNIDTVSRIHNGGPKGHTKSATRKYAEKVKKNYGSV